MAQSLLSTNTRVAVPVIIVKIGDYTFGMYDKQKVRINVNDKLYAAYQITYPNYLEELDIVKVNGTVNSYTLKMVYPITQNDDPNLIDKILSTVSSTRKIEFTYGDAASPSFMYRQEEALITNVESQIDIASSRISYTIEAVSSSALSSSTSFNFIGRSAKPSDIIKEMLYNKKYGLQDVFYGMSSKALVEQYGLIPGDDQEVQLESKTGITPLNYLDYLVSCMTSAGDNKSSLTKGCRYVMTIHDDTSNVLSGPYFKITRVLTSASSSSSIDDYTIDIGYPTKDYVVSFTIDDNQAYTILYNYSEKLDRTDYTYQIDDYGNISESVSPQVALKSGYFGELTADTANYWASVTSFPVSCTLKIKGLLRAAVLMSYLRVHVYFYGHAHSSSGRYIITKQEDNISKNGYYTTLSLTRISGDE